MDWKQHFVRLTFNATARGDFYELMANFVEDGLPVFDALAALDKQYERNGDTLRHVTKDAMRAMRGAKGRARSLGGALAPWVNPIEAMAIESGGESGRLVEGLRMAKRLCDTHSRVRAVVLAQATYPAVLVLMFLGFFVMLGLEVMPTLTELLPRHRWPQSGRILGWLGDNAIAITIAMALLGVVYSAVFLATRSRWTGPVRDTFDRWVFPWSLSSSVASALLLSSVSVMLRAGVPFGEVLERLSKASGPWERYHFARMRAQLRLGRPEGEALGTELFEKAIRWQIHLYGRTSNFALAIDRLSHRVVEHVLKQVASRFGVARGLIMVGIAGMVVWTYSTFFAITMATRSAATL